MTLDGHLDYVTSVDFNKDSSLLVSSSLDGIMCVFIRWGNHPVFTEYSQTYMEREGLGHDTYTGSRESHLNQVSVCHISSSLDLTTHQSTRAVLAQFEICALHCP